MIFFRIRLEELAKFLKAAMENFSRPIQEDDYDALLETIYYLKEVRDRQYEIEDMFDPIKVIKIMSGKNTNAFFPRLIN